MKNKEKYLNEILEAFILEKKCGFIKDYVLKAPSCNDLECDKCTIKMQKWLEAEYQEPIKLSDDEIVILKNIDKEYKWIARDKSDDLFFYQNKPERDILMWKSFVSYIRGGIFNHLFQFIKWEDEEPYNIDELLKQNGVER